MTAPSYALNIKRVLVPLLTRPRVAQFIKWAVYTCLFVNFAFYLSDDLLAMKASLATDADWFAMAETFVTSIDTVAWLLLIVLLEFETYVLSEEAYTRRVERLMLSVRIICYLAIGLSALFYFSAALAYYDLSPMEDIRTTCDLSGQEIYLQTGVIEYELITPENCGVMPAAEVLVRVGEDSSVIAPESLPGIRFLSWVDVVNAWVWILVVLLIEVEIHLQWEDRYGSRLLRFVRAAKTLSYLVLIGNGFIWIVTGYPLYTWDAFLWIFGFWAIELNLAEWEQERLEYLAEQVPGDDAARG